MKLTKRQLAIAKQALGYAVMYAKSEQETAEFALLKLDIDSAIIRQNEQDKIQNEHDKKGCRFQYCDQNPPCKLKCRYR